MKFSQQIMLVRIDSKPLRETFHRALLSLVGRHNMDMIGSSDRYALIADIFNGLPGQPPPDTQTAVAFRGCLDWFAEFVRVHSERLVNEWKFDQWIICHDESNLSSNTNAAILSTLADILLLCSKPCSVLIPLCSSEVTLHSRPDLREKSCFVREFGQYGCVMFAMSHWGWMNEQTVTIQLLSLDAWRHTVGAHGSSAHPTDVFHALRVGDVPLGSFDKFLKQFESRLAAAQKKHAGERTAAGGQQGHQKTATFIQAVMFDALDDMSLLRDAEATNQEEVQFHGTPHQPSGGLTDVGLHTGGRARSTSWPLAQAVIAHVVGMFFNNRVQMMKILLVEWEIWIVELIGESVQPIDVRNAMHMLQSVSIKTQELSDEGFNMSSLILRITDARSEFEVCQQSRFDSIGEQYQLSPLINQSHEWKIDGQLCQFPNLSLPPEMPNYLDEFSLDACRARAKSNLAILNQAPHDLFTATEFLAWLNSSIKDTSQSATGRKFEIARIEDWAFRSADQLLSLEATSHENVRDAEEINSVFAIVQCFTKLNSDNIDKFHGRLAVEQRSRVLLVSWIGFCLVDRLCCKLCPLVKRYDVPLRYHDLEHISCSDGNALDALSALCLYLHSRSRRGEMLAPIFCFRDNDATLNFVDNFVKLDGHKQQYDRVWVAEQQLAKNRISKHTELINSQRAALVPLRKSLAAVQLEIQRLKDENQKKRGLLDVLRPLQYQEDQILDQITKANLAPQPVIQPLPQSEQAAMRVLFFLYAPSYLRNLYHIASHAQSLLWVSPVPIQASLSFTWAKHFDDLHHHSYGGRVAGNVGTSKQGTNLLLNHDQLADLLQSNLSIPSQIGPKLVDNFGNDPGEEGVWFPDSPQVFFKLNDSFSNYRAKSMRESWTEAFPAPGSTLQWMMCQHNSENVSKDRNNLAIANSSQCPNWMNQLQFQALAQLRAQPFLQFRQLCLCLKERSVPFHHPSVQALIRQLMYQVGELKINSTQQLKSVEMRWKTGLDSTNDSVFGVLIKELYDFSDRLQDRIRDHSEMLVLLDVLAYLMYFGARDRDKRQTLDQLRHKCVGIIKSWSAITQSEIDGCTAEDYKHIPQLRAKQCVFAMYGVCAFADSEALDVSEITALLEFNVLATNGHVYESECHDSELLQLFKHLRARVKSVMSARIPFLADFMHDHIEFVDTVLTQVMRNVFHDLPARLEFFQFASSLECFEAITGQPDRHVYHINIFNGIVLLDGNPPRSLPADVLNNALFQRVFGDQNFEVSVAYNGSLQTTSERNGCRFQFSVIDSELQIIEFPVAQHLMDDDLCLELLPSGDNPSEFYWMKELPVRVQSLHSHWLCRSTGTVFVRSRCFPQTKIYYVLFRAEQESTGDGQAYKCARVPPHMRHLPWLELVRLTKSEDLQTVLVNFQQPPIPALFKFEHPDHVHLLLNLNTNLFRVHLPRYQLEFELTNTGLLKSLDFKDYYLSKKQQFDNCWYNFKQYLILKPGDIHFTRPPWTARSKVLVPKGLTELTNGELSIKDFGDRPWDRDTMVLSMHPRFRDFRARDVENRLQLAAICAHTDTGVMDRRWAMRGCEMAIELIRKSFIDHPMTPGELLQCDHLAGLSTLCCAPTVNILCCQLFRSAHRMSFLHSKPPVSFSEHCQRLLDNSLLGHSMTAYTVKLTRGELPVRQRLTDIESTHVFGAEVPQLPGLCRVMPRSVDTIGVPNSPVQIEYVLQRYSDLQAMITEVPATTQPSDAKFPLEAWLGDAEPADHDLSCSMMNELKSSWDECCHLSHFELNPTFIEDPRYLQEAFSKMQLNVKLKLAEIENYLSASLRTIPQAGMTQINWHTGAVEALWAASHGRGTPQWKMTEMMHCALGTPGFQFEHYNFFLKLSSRDRENLKHAVMIWMHLAVLDDKLAKLVRMSNQFVGSNANQTEVLCDIVAELRSSKSFDGFEHPNWLAFEVDMCLQIRPAQCSIVNTVLNNPGSISQLNMGLGKTRVILPLLILTWTSGKKLVRLNLLAQLFDEGFQFLHENLCGGLFGLKLFQFPFNREVDLSDPKHAPAILSHAQLCEQNGGAAIVTPESRCSMLLKISELKYNIIMSKDRSATEIMILGALNSFVHIPWIDVCDESDEIFRVTFQQIYAAGSSLDLPSMTERSIVVSTVLHTLVEHHPTRALLNNVEFAILDATCQRPCSGAFFSDFRLLSDALAAEFVALSQSIIQGIIQNSPYEMKQWLDKLVLNIGFDRISEFVLNDQLDPDSLIPPAQFSYGSHRDYLLELRGILGCGILKHCLLQRYRVDYGVPGPEFRRSNRKRLAVPYRASDVPSERSEFAHPDCTLILTTLSFYFSGLDEQQIRDTFARLISVGQTEREQRYLEWFLSGAGNLTSDEAGTIDNVHKIDLSNKKQFKLLTRVMARNMRFVDYFLLTCVFPVDTMQFSSRIKTSAWHLVEYPGGQTVGFSGTNDHHRLLPLHVKQFPLADPELQATNGLMLTRMIKHSQFMPMSISSQSCLTSAPWQQLMMQAHSQHCVALIDAGALLAGVEMHSIAEFMVSLISNEAPPLSSNESLHVEAARGLQAVVYYDNSHFDWMVRDFAGRVWPLRSSPIDERDAFVIFDERHCRGADMKLRRYGRALLTLGPRMNKDKLMQAAGRMRQFGDGQSLLLVAAADVVHSIQSISNQLQDSEQQQSSSHLPPPRRRLTRTANLPMVRAVSVLDSLYWVMHNTIEASRSGLKQWALNGLHYFFTNNSPSVENSYLEEHIQIEDFYGHPMVSQELPMLLQQKIDSTCSSSWRQSFPPAWTCVKTMLQTVEKFGRGKLVHVAAFDEECERELEKDKEIEQEAEVEIPQQIPRPETIWTVPSNPTLNSLPTTNLTIHSFPKAIQMFVRRKHVDQIQWQQASQLYVTENFVRSVSNPQDSANRPAEGGANPMPIAAPRIRTIGSVGIDHSMYLRRVNCMLLFQTGDLLIISDREANDFIQNVELVSTTAVLLHHGYSKLANVGFVPARILAAFGRPAVLSDAQIAAMSLFNSETMFLARIHPALTAMIPSKQAKAGALQLPLLRGLGSHIARSNLELMCEAVSGGV